MGNAKQGDASVQAYSSSGQSHPSLCSDPSPGDGFTSEEVQAALQTRPAEPWCPIIEYADVEIRDLRPGPRPVTFMGRIANIFDVVNAPKTPRSAKGCFKLCVKDSTGAITVRMWYINPPFIRLGSLVSIWTTHISNDEMGMLSTSSAPMFASLFPERDRNCHMMIHENSDDGTLCARPLGFRKGQALDGLMTLQNFIDGGYDIPNAKVLLVVKSIGPRKTITRKDESSVENINVHVHDDTSEGTLGLWGTAACSPVGRTASDDSDILPAAVSIGDGWKAGETVILLQAPGWKTGRNTYLTLTSATMIDIDPEIPDVDWLRRWSIRQKSREAINPPFPKDTFDLEALKTSPRRCLYTIGELDDFARAAPNETFQGYLSVLITEVKLLENFRRRMLFSGECCNVPIYTNALAMRCKSCDQQVHLRLNPRIIGQVVDESAAIGTGKLLFSDDAWQQLLGRKPQAIVKLRSEEIEYLSDRLLFCRVTLLFGWTGDESKAGGRICVLGVQA